MTDARKKLFLDESGDNKPDGGPLKHRPRIVIYVEVLAELYERPSGPTRLSRAANLSYDKCVEILAELEAKGLVLRSDQEGHAVFSATPAGSEVLRQWSSLWEKLRP